MLTCLTIIVICKVTLGSIFNSCNVWNSASLGADKLVCRSKTQDDLYQLFIASKFLPIPSIQPADKQHLVKSCRNVWKSTTLAGWSAEILLNEDAGTCFGFLQRAAQSAQMSQLHSSPAYLDLRLVGQFFVSFVPAMRVLSFSVRTFSLSYPTMRILSFLRPLSLLASTALWVALSFTSFNFSAFKNGLLLDALKHWYPKTLLVKKKKLSSDFSLPCCVCARFLWEADDGEEGVDEEVQDGGGHHLLHRLLHTVRSCCQVEQNHDELFSVDTKYFSLKILSEERCAPLSMRRSARRSRFQGGDILDHVFMFFYFFWHQIFFTFLIFGSKVETYSRG